jgi:uncharacterized protein (TIGR00288 family)
LSRKIALLIDAENISYKDLPRVLEEVALHGQLVLRAIYGDWQSSNLQKWHEVAEQNNFKIRHHTNGTKTKNSADIKLIMDAIEVLYRTPIDVFCLVTNDADYVLLCDKIHEAKKLVIGIGYQQAAEAFIRACDKFIFIGRGEVPPQSLIPVAVEPPPAPLPSTPPESTNSLVVWQLLLDAFAKAPQDANGWVVLSSLSDALRQLQPTFDNYGYKSLLQLLQSMPDFIELHTLGNYTTARLKKHTPSIQPQLRDIRKLLSDAFAKALQNADRWALLSALGEALQQMQPGFQAGSYGHITLTQLLESMPDFVEIQLNGNIKSARLKKNIPSKTPPLNTIQKLISDAFAIAPQDANKWSTLSALGNTLPQVQPGFKTSNYGHSTLLKLLQNMPDFVELRGKGPLLSARLKK